MVSIVSTAQANLLNEDAYKKVRANNRSCGVWGTAFCCLNLKRSVIIIAIIYGIMYLFSNIGVLILGMACHLNVNNFGKLRQMNNLLLFIINSFEKSLFRGFNTSNIFSQMVLGTKFLRILLKIFKVSCYIHEIIFIIGMLTGILGWFWLTAILLVTLWVESIKSVSSILYITYLLIFILKNWYFKVAAVFVSAAFLLVTYFCSYYFIQVVYSLYLVQLAGGRGDEYVAYYKLRRLFQNIGVTNSSQLSSTVIAEKNLIKNTEECSPLIRGNQGTYSNV